MNAPLWFFWGQKTMSFLRYMTLRSACQIHDDVRLVVRDKAVRPSVKWHESQDFMHEGGADWMPEALKLPITVVPLRDVAPQLADLRASDVHTSDLLAWWLMATVGGTACDMDIVFLKPIPAIEHDVEVVVHNGKLHRYDYVPIGIFQGRPHEKWMETYRNARSHYDPNIYQCCGGENLKPWPEPVLSPFIVYPWAGAIFLQILDYCFKSDHWPPIHDECIGIHWYCGGTQKENQRINGPDDLTSGAVSWAVKQVLAREAIPL